MQTTTNIGLKTYEANDPTDWLGEFNYNMNKIDEAVGSQNTQIDLVEATANSAVTTANSAVTTASEALSTANSKTSINDSVASNTETYSSNKINELLDGAGGDFPDYSNSTLVTSVNGASSTTIRIDYTATEDCFIYTTADFRPSSASFQEFNIYSSDSGRTQLAIQYENHFYAGFTSQIYKLKAGDKINTYIADLSQESADNVLKLYKIPIR